MRYLMTFAYDGSKYNGYQKQPDVLTIQGILEDKLTQINSNKFVGVSASGRTDSGVHAINQKAHFDLDLDISKDKLRNSLNKMLPPDIYIKEVKKVAADFHARFDVTRKIYTYKINVGEYNPLQVNYVYQLNNKLDIEAMKEATRYFIGEHDFTSYTKGCEVKEDYTRKIHTIDIVENNSIIEITFAGSGFLRYMVRNMVGSLLEVGLGKLKPSSIGEIIEAKDRKKAGITAPSCGLYLMDVEYTK